jgi:hypothetical protein
MEEECDVVGSVKQRGWTNNWLATNSIEEQSEEAASYIIVSF